MAENTATKDKEGLGGLFDRAYASGAMARSVFSVPGGKSYVLVPEGYKAEKLDEVLIAPRSLDLSIRANTLDSFIDYVTRYGGVDAGAIFADVKTPAIMAILDYHGTDNAPTNRQHRVTYSPLLSEEWQAWRGRDGTWKPQEDMVRFVEEHQLDIREPDGASILELVGVLEAKRNVSFKKCRQRGRACRPAARHHRGLST